MIDVVHREFFNDLLAIEKELTEDKFEEFNNCVDKALYEIHRDPHNEGAPCRYVPLTNYRKKKFHSTLRPRKNEKADYRIVFRYDEGEDTLYLLGIGKRKIGEPDDIWRILKERDQQRWLR